MPTTTAAQSTRQDAGINPASLLLTFYGIIAFLTTGFMAGTAAAITFSQHHHEHAASVAGWIGFAFLVVDMFYIGWD